MTLQLYNTLSRKKEIFTPADEKHVRMYVCGPTVYGRAHLGNARSVVVYDVLFRLLRHIYGAEQVQYVRNITDVDDKINAAAKELGITIGALTKEVTGWFHSDIAALNVLPADAQMIEPKATEHIAQMVAMIEQLIANNHAYATKDGHVIFAVKSMPDYGKLSGRVQDDLESGARVKVEAYKKDPNDFVLWKPAGPDDDTSSVFDSPWGKGRPGWHIECSAMSTHYLGADFDIHGGGSDLMFPHHENEIAQSCGANPGSHFARYWVHNGFLTVNGEKMSKSVGNFVTVKDLLDKGVKGEVIRWALLSTKYNEPLDWSDKLVEDAKKELDYFYRVIGAANFQNIDYTNALLFELDNKDFVQSAGDDLNIPALRVLLRKWAEASNTSTQDNYESTSSDAELRPKDYNAAKLKYFGAILGILQQEPQLWFKGVDDDSAILVQIAARNEAKKAKNWAEADRIRNELKSQGILLEDKPGGATDWRRE